jgi:hypothetical protein
MCQEALRDKDHIYALVRGSAISANGFSKSLTMPLGEAQQVGRGVQRGVSKGVKDRYRCEAISWA